MNPNDHFKRIASVIALIIAMVSAGGAITHFQREDPYQGQYPVEIYVYSDRQAAVRIGIPAGFSLESVPVYSGESHTFVNDNTPFFEEDEITARSYEYYGDLDSRGRCTGAAACLGPENFPAEGAVRADISSIVPVGLTQERYECVDKGYLYNRCNLIAWMLSAEDANAENLVCGTRYMNYEMLKYEDKVRRYIQNTGNHVMYRVTPVYLGEELLCRGLLMEGKSVEDDQISYCVFFYDVQPGIYIDYKTGASKYTGVFLDIKSDTVILPKDYGKGSLSDTSSPSENAEQCYILNIKTKKFHLQSCPGASSISEKNKAFFEGPRQSLIDGGYKPCGECRP